MTCHFVTILVIKHGEKQVACTDILNKFKPFVVYVKPVYDTFIYISDPCENAKYDFPLYMYGDLSHKKWQRTNCVCSYFG